MKSASNSFLAIRERLTYQLDEVCPYHGVYLTAFKNNEAAPFCEKCAAEAKAAEEEELIRIIAEESKKARTYSWLKDKSILMDRTLLDASFDSYEPRNEEQKKNKDKAMYLAQDYLDGKTFNTFLQGTPGTGKSHLAMSMLKQVNEHANPFQRCLFVAVDEVVRRIKDSFDNRERGGVSEYQAIRLMSDADLLVLDDLGAEVGGMSDRARASDFIIRTLYSVLNNRMAKPTIFTTNLSGGQLERVYDHKLFSRMLKGVTAKSSIVFKESQDMRRELDW